MRFFTFISLALFGAFMVASCDPYEECLAAGGTPQSCAYLKVQGGQNADGGVPPPAPRFYSTWESDVYREALKAFVGPQSWISRVVPGGDTYIWSGELAGAITGMFFNFQAVRFSCTGNEGLASAVDRAVSGILPVTGIPPSPSPGYYHGVLGISVEVNGGARIVHLLCLPTTTDVTELDVDPVRMLATFVALPPGGRVEQVRQIMPADGAANMNIEYHPEMSR